jgi:hypothetical protein
MIEPIDYSQYESLTKLLKSLKCLGVDTAITVGQQFREEIGPDWEICQCGETESDCECKNYDEDDESLHARYYK